MTRGTQIYFFADHVVVKKKVLKSQASKKDLTEYFFVLRPELFYRFSDQIR